MPRAGKTCRKRPVSGSGRPSTGARATAGRPGGPGKAPCRGRNQPGRPGRRHKTAGDGARTGPRPGRRIRPARGRDVRSRSGSGPHSFQRVLDLSHTLPTDPGFGRGIVTGRDRRAPGRGPWAPVREDRGIEFEAGRRGNHLAAVVQDLSARRRSPATGARAAFRPGPVKPDQARGRQIVLRPVGGPRATAHQGAQLFVPDEHNPRLNLRPTLAQGRDGFEGPRTPGAKAAVTFQQ